MKALLIRLGLAASVLAVLALGILATAELQDVAVLTSFDADGRPHQTRLWSVDADGVIWLRASHVRRAWYQRLRGNPDVELERAGERRAYRASIIPGDDAQRRINRRMREKYGTTDALIHLLEGSPPGIPVKLEAKQPEPRRS